MLLFHYSGKRKKIPTSPAPKPTLINKDHPYVPKALLNTTPFRATKPKKPKWVIYKDNEQAVPKQQAKVDRTDPDYRPSFHQAHQRRWKPPTQHSVSCPKYIVFSTCLKDLIFQCRCRFCGSILMADSLEDNLGYMRGSLLTVRAYCLHARSSVGVEIAACHRKRPLTIILSPSKVTCWRAHQKINVSSYMWLMRLCGKTTSAKFYLKCLIEGFS